jgi:hypothetical protein
MNAVHNLCIVLDATYKSIVHFFSVFQTVDLDFFIFAKNNDAVLAKCINVIDRRIGETCFFAPFFLNDIASGDNKAALWESEEN